MEAGEMGLVCAQVHLDPHCEWIRRDQALEDHRCPEQQIDTPRNPGTQKQTGPG